MDEVKAALRETALRARRGLTHRARAAASAAVIERLGAIPELMSARTVLLHAPLADEIDVTPLFARLRDTGATVLLPRVNEQQLELVAVDDLSALVPGHRGVREPAGPVVPPDGLQAAVIPGVAFDPSGARLGHGGGHYDRLIPTLPEACLRVGVCFSCQVVPRVPRASHDAAVDLVVTERATYRSGTHVA